MHLLFCTGKWHGKLTKSIIFINYKLKPHGNMNLRHEDGKLKASLWNWARPCLHFFTEGLGMYPCGRAPLGSISIPQREKKWKKIRSWFLKKHTYQWVLSTFSKSEPISPTAESCNKQVRAMDSKQVDTTWGTIICLISVVVFLPGRHSPVIDSLPFQSTTLMH